jgi:hypothetical protein
MLVTPGVTASYLSLLIAGPLISGLTLCLALWLAWVAFGHAAPPLHWLPAARRDAAPAAAVREPEFSDTEATWQCPEQTANGVGAVPSAQSCS